MQNNYFSISLPSFSELREIRERWTWQEIQWGKNNGIVQSGDAVAYAMELLDEDRRDFNELLSLSIEDGYSDTVDSKIAVLCDLERKESNEQITLVWRKTLLEWLYYNMKDNETLQEKIDALYADFNYPIDMKFLIGYMPIQSNKQKTKWNIRELLKKYIEEYMDV